MIVHYNMNLLQHTKTPQMKDKLRARHTKEPMSHNRYNLTKALNVPLNLFVYRLFTKESETIPFQQIILWSDIPLKQHSIFLHFLPLKSILHRKLPTTMLLPRQFQN